MNVFSLSLIVVIGAVAGSGLVACRKEEGKPAKVKVQERKLLGTVAVEMRADGLAYLPGATQPFTGDAIAPYAEMPWLVKLKEPYTGGKRDGDKLELFKSGKTKALRRYEKGVPKYAASYHKNGQMKFELNLNAQDKGEGPYQRWYEDGTLESTAGLDAEERWHGELKEWTRAGELKSHHIFKNGLLQQIIFETEESKAARQAAGVELPKPAIPDRPTVVTPSAE
jgi:hypothetical protein